MHVPAWPVLPSSTLAPDAILAKFASRSLSGMGMEICDESGCYDDGQGGAPISPGGVPSDFGPLCPASMMQVGQSCVSVGDPGFELPPVRIGSNTGYQVPSQNSAQWGMLAAQLLKSGLTLAQIQAIQPGTVVSANGAILRQSTGFAVPTPNTSTNIGLRANMSTTTLVVAGLVAAAFLFSRGGGR